MTRDRLSVLLMLWTLIICAVPNIALSITEDMTVWGRLTNSLLPIGVWWLLLSVSRKIGRTVLWMFPVMFFGAFQLVLLYLYGRSVIAVDMFLNLVTTNPGEAGELLGNMLPIIVVVVVMYIPAIVAGIVAVCKRWRLPERFLAVNRRCSLIAIVLGIICLAVSFMADRNYRVMKDLYPVNVIYNVGLAVGRTARMGDYDATSGNYRFDSRLTAPADSLRRVIVMVIGETSRADRWSVNGYPRPTSPSVTEENGFISFGKALSESNTTHKSVPMLLSHLSAEIFADSVYNVKSIVTAFKEAGYRTAFFSNQRYNHSFIDRYAFEADTTLFIKEQDGGNHYDHELAGLLSAELGRGDSLLFVVLHTYGSHFSYDDRYPAESAVFTPASPLEASAANKQALDNAYDNTIVYTATLLDSVTSLLRNSAAEAAMIYASDHGEDIFDDERGLFLHASPAPSVYQIHVPMFVWYSPAYASMWPQMVTSTKKNSTIDVATSQSLFHTALHLGHVATAVSDSTKSVASGAYAAPRRMYLNDHNEGVELSRSGLRSLDIARLDSLSIAH